MMRTIGNILWWFPCFGFVSAFVLIIIGSIMTLTVIMAPFGLGLIQLGKFYLAPFTRSLVSEGDIKKKPNSLIWRLLSLILFIIYLPFGFGASIGLFMASIMQCFTIIGIPFAIINLKSIGAVFNPIGKVCVSNEMKEIVERKKAEKQYKELSNKLNSSYTSDYSSRSPSPIRYKHVSKKKQEKKHKKSY